VIVISHYISTGNNPETLVEVNRWETTAGDGNSELIKDISAGEGEGGLMECNPWLKSSNGI